VRSGPGEARTILLFHTISARPPEQPRMVRTFLKVHTWPRLGCTAVQRLLNPVPINNIISRTGGWVLHQPPWSFGFDSQTRGTRENRRILC
jgi:hypothetical protein